MAPDRLLLLEPRGTCGGVDAAISALAWLVLLDEPDVHCFHQVVHNDHVVARFERLGVTFVDSYEQIPADATVLLSAHGTAPDIARRIGDRAGRTVDAVCPLVAKVHREVAGRAAAGDRILYVGRRGHDETDGTTAIAPDRITLVDDAAAVAALRAPDGPVAVLAQTTLRVDEVEQVEAAARERFGTVWIPPRSDICDASSTRQAAVRMAAARCDAMVVVGSATSSNTASLVDAALRAGAARAVRVAGPADLPADLTGTVAVTAGASTPDDLIDAVIDRLGGPEGAEVVRGPRERVQGFAVPAPIRRLIEARAAAGTLDGALASVAADPDVSAEELLRTAEARLATRETVAG